MNDKQKGIVVAVLVVLVLGIGAFQFANMSSPAPPKPAPEKEKDTVSAEATGEPEVDPMAGLFALNMKPRDPFQEDSLPQIETATPPTQPTPPPVSNPGRTIRPPRPLDGGLNPWDVQGPLPNSGPNGLKPSDPLVNPDEPNFRVNGVILGARPAAVFVDGNGNQRLVTVGSSLDGDSQLVSVEKGKVTVRRKGKTLTYNVGGTPDAK